MELKIQNHPQLRKCEELARTAKQLRDEAAQAKLNSEIQTDFELKRKNSDLADALDSEAQLAEANAVREFRDFRASIISALKTEKAKLKKINSEKSAEQLVSINGKFKELCSLFGHDAERISNGQTQIFRCKCCNAELTYPEYVLSHFTDTKYKGGIVKYLFFDNSPILV